MTTLSPIQKKQFSTQGFLVVENYLDSRSLKKFRELLFAHVKDSSRNKRTENANLVYVPCISIVDPAVNGLLKEKSLFELVASFHNEKVVMVKDEVVVKKAHSSLPAQWHQDNAYFPTPNLITCLIALDSMGSKSGGYSVVPQSHRGPIVHEKHKEVGMLHLAAHQLKKFGAHIDLSLNPGDMLLLNGNTVHRGLSNVSDVACASYTAITAPVGYRLEKNIA